MHYLIFLERAPGLMSQMLTAEYILSVLYMSVCSLRLWFYVGDLNSYLEFMSDYDKDTGKLTFIVCLLFSSLIMKPIGKFICAFHLLI
jgi:hypothetical protein